MNLLEHEGKKLFSEYGIKVPRGFVTKSLEEAENFARDLCGERADECIVLKAQIPAGKRGKTGGVVFTDLKNFRRNWEKVISFLEKKGFPQAEILTDEKIEFEKQMYLSVTVNRFERCLELLYSPEGGMEIEDIAKQFPEKLVSVKFFPEDNAEDVFKKIPEKARSVARALIHLSIEKDLLLAEINPLVELKDGKLVALDAKIIADDNAIFRQAAFAKRASIEESELERKAKQFDVSYVELDGDIAIIGNGAGMVMATLDLILENGGKPANFCDVGGGATTLQMEKALEIVLQKPNVKKLLVNIFGGITHCDFIAKGMIDYFEQFPTKIPVTVRMIGTNEDKAHEMLKAYKFPAFRSMEEASAYVVKM